MDVCYFPLLARETIRLCTEREGSVTLFFTVEVKNEGAPVLLKKKKKIVKLLQKCKINKEKQLVVLFSKQEKVLLFHCYCYAAQ